MKTLIREEPPARFAVLYCWEGVPSSTLRSTAIISQGILYCVRDKVRTTMFSQFFRSYTTVCPLGNGSRERKRIFPVDEI